MSESAVMARGSGEVSSWDLVRAVQGGDREAFGELYRRHWGLVYRFVASRVGAGLAEDITSETFLRALRGISSVTYEGRDIGAWLRTIARNLVRDHLKSAYHRRVIASAFEDDCLVADWVSPGVDEDVVRGETAEQVRALLARLPRRYQRYLTLRYLGGLSVRQTARVLGHREGTVKSGTSRALRDVRDLVAGEGVA